MDRQDGLPRRVLWQRLDVAGMDACIIDRSGDGYAVYGTALFLLSGLPAKLDYQVSFDLDWCSQSARVRGWVGAEVKSYELLRSPQGSWTVKGEPIVGVDGLLDVDLGFTPATITNAIKRLRIATGAVVETTAVWLDPDDWSFKPLVQIYRRQSSTVFA